MALPELQLLPEHSLGAAAWVQRALGCPSCSYCLSAVWVQLPGCSVHGAARVAATAWAQFGCSCLGAASTGLPELQLLPERSLGAAAWVQRAWDCLGTICICLCYECAYSVVVVIWRIALEEQKLNL